jgi:ribonuclease PH
VTIQRRYTRHAEGSVLVSFGHTRCCAPRRWKRRCRRTSAAAAKAGSRPNTACCRAPPTRAATAKPPGKQSGRTQEIQRLIGAVAAQRVRPAALGERTIQLDCDVLQADGGTRTAAITGAFVAAHDAVSWLLAQGKLTASPIRDFVAAVSVGIVQGVPLLDLEYTEDSACDTDMNVVMTGAGGFVEVQGTAEGAPFTRAEMDALLALADKGIANWCAAEGGAGRPEAHAATGAGVQQRQEAERTAGAACGLPWNW